MAPDRVDIDPGFLTDFFVVEETPHKVIYKLWVFRGGERWHPIGPEDTSDDRSDHWIFTPPLPDGSKFAYWLGVYGHANSPWRVRVTVQQRDPAEPNARWTVRGSWTETGVLNDAGAGGGVGNTGIVRVNLT
jgi:hypothetical protein